MIKKFFVRWIICMMLIPGVCYPQALPSLVGKAISGTIQKRATARGFAANDPRFAQTLASAGSTIGGAAAAAAVVTLAGITAPAWMTVAATAALGALFTVGIDLAIDQFQNWKMNPDGTVTVTKKAPASPPMVSGATAYFISTNTTCYASTASAAAYSCFGYSWPSTATNTYSIRSCASVDPATNNGFVLNCIRSRYNIAERYTYNDGTFGVKPQTSSTRVCPGGQIWYSNGCVAETSAPGTPTTQTATQAVNALTPEELALPASPRLIAEYADAAWRKAAEQPGYTGLPYDAANPVTEADAAAWRQANPDAWPKVGDVVRPVPPPSGGTQGDAFVLPNPDAPPSGDNPTPPEGSTIDWAIPPTGETIGKVNAPVSFTPTVFAAPTGCPAPIPFTMLGQQHAISYQPFCDLMSLVAPIFIALGAMAAALIFASSLK